MIFKVEIGSFVNLPSLKILRLNANFIKKVEGTIFEKLTNLEALDVSENLITTIENNTFSSLVNLRVLALHSNNLKNMKTTTFLNNTKLSYLYLHKNLLQSIPTGLFQHQKALKALKLHSNRIKWFDKSSFKGLAALQTLTLNNNLVSEQKIGKDAFTELVGLRYLSLDSFILCCYATKTNPNLNCESHGNELSSCEDMLKTLAIRLGIWIQGILASFGNLAVILWWAKQSKHTTKMKTQKERAIVQSFLLSNLACADLLMGVYLLFIAVHDAMWMGEYFKYDVEWRSGIGCKVAGFISTLSCEASVMFLVVITTDRVISICFYFSSLCLSLKLARIICSIVWVTSSVLSFTPLLIPSYFNDDASGFSFYGRSTVCLPLQLSNDRPAGWEYSVGVFVIFNGAAFLFILSGYFAIFIKVLLSARKMRSATSSRRPLGKRLVFIILTDFLCWVPVVLLSALSLTGHFDDSSGKVYAVVAVFVLPLNSSINPVLYTFSTAETGKKLKKIFPKWCFHKRDLVSIRTANNKTRDSYLGVHLKGFFSRSSSVRQQNSDTINEEQLKATTCHLSYNTRKTRSTKRRTSKNIEECKTEQL